MVCGEAMILIGIAGGTCSGKTTLANELASVLGGECIVIPLDNYYCAFDEPQEVRAERNHDLPEAFEWKLLLDHIDRLRAGETVPMPLYSYKEHNRTDRIIELNPKEVMILEGIYALYRTELFEKLHLTVFLDSTVEERRERRLQRDLMERSADPGYTLRKFDQLVEPAYSRFVEPTKNAADIVASNLEWAKVEILKALSNPTVAKSGWRRAD